MLPSLSFAQKVEKVMLETYCVKLDTLEQVLSEYGEIPFIRGLSQRDPLGTVSLVVFLNPQTQTWTIVEKFDTDKYCIMAVGSNLEPVPNETKKVRN